MIVTWLQRYALVIVSAAALAGWGMVGVQAVRLASAKSSLAKEQKARSDDRREAEELVRLQSEAFRAEEARRNKLQQEALDAKEAQLARLRGDIAIRDAAAGRLHERIAALVAAAREAARNPQAAPSGPPTDDSTGMLADVLGRCIARVRLLATVADERAAAGATCERAYDALTETP